VARLRSFFFSPELLPERQQVNLMTAPRFKIGQLVRCSNKHVKDAGPCVVLTVIARPRGKTGYRIRSQADTIEHVVDEDELRNLPSGRRLS
jgi:hypothetical protein